MSVCVYVQPITFELLKLGTSFSVFTHLYKIGGILSTKLIYSHTQKSVENIPKAVETKWT